MGCLKNKGACPAGNTGRSKMNLRKTIIVTAVLCGLAGRALALIPPELDNRIHMLTAKFEAMQQKPDKRVPADLLAKAKGVVLLDRTKAGFIFAYQGGNGVALVKDRSGEWSPAAFLTASEASLGFQIGGEQNFYVILLMTTNATRALADSLIDFGGEARGTAGNNSGGVEGTVNASDSVIVYDDRQGLFGGAAIKGGALSPDNHANEVYYGQYVSMSDILFDRKVNITDAAAALAKKISVYSEK